MKFSDLCSPAYVYFVVSIFYVIINSFTNLKLTSILLKILFIILWSLFLNLLCSNGYNMLSWILVILPFFSFN
jgi:hypothetical protein